MGLAHVVLYGIGRFCWLGAEDLPFGWSGKFEFINSGEWWANSMLVHFVVQLLDTC